MKTKAAFFSSRLHWINLPGALLMAFLQRTPVITVAVATEEMIIASPVGALLRGAVTVGALGAVNTLVGATPLVPNTGTETGVSATVGTPVSVFYTVNGTQTPPMSWKIGGTVPAGLNFSGLTGPGTVNVTSLQLSGTPTTAGTFNVTIQAWEFANGSGSSTNAYPYTITVSGGIANVAPSFTTQPASQTAAVGSAVSFSASATGTPTPTYQWKKGGVNIAGATGSSYSIASVANGDAGDYTVVATNTAGSATSNIATLTVSAALAAPAFTAHPAGQSVTAGTGVTFTASATGNPTPTYQWRKGGANIPGATNSSYTIASTSVADSGDYTVVAANSQGSATSNVATLTVNAAQTAPSFTLQPAGQSVRTGATVTFTAAATGNPSPTYQWKKDGVDIGGATAAAFTLVSATPGDRGVYTVVATNSQGHATSAGATLLVSSNWTDFNVDGVVDVLLQNVATGQRVLWLMGGPNGAFVIQGLDLGSLDASWRITGTADFNLDGAPDVLLENTASGQRVLWLMGGPNNAFVIQALDLGSLDAAWHIVGLADFNSDGAPDILLENTASGQRVLWLMGGPNNAFVIQALDLGSLDAAWHIVGLADFNSDGAPDVVLENASSGQRVLWLMGGPNNAFVLQGLDLGFLDASWHIAKTTDFNGDGAPDILLENSGSGQRVLWLMGGPNNAFVTQGLDLGFLDAAWHIVP